MRVLISGGGTGGHVYPALAVVAQLPRQREVEDSNQKAEGRRQKAEGSNQKTEDRRQRPLTSDLGPLSSDLCPLSSEHLLWVGSTGRMEQALVERAGITFRGIDTGQVRGISPLTALRNAGKMIVGIQQSKQIIQAFQPDVCFVTGGYVCAPVVVACRLLRIPVLIYLPDIVPGWAIRLLSRLAQRVAVSFPAAARYFGGEVPQGKAVVTGYPVRAELLALTGQGQLSPAEHVQNRAKARLQLAQHLQRPLAQADVNGQPLPLVLVWGGSQGARTINQATWAALPQVLPKAQVLHVVGERDWPLWQEQKPLSPELAERYHPLAYLHEEMPLALAAADLTVARAGASSLGEFPIARLPSILVPLLGVNQEANAEQLIRHGAAVMVADDLLAKQLAPTLLNLLSDTTRRQAMEQALAQLARPDAALHIAQELQVLGLGDSVIG